MSEETTPDQAESTGVHTHDGAFAGMHSHDGGALHWHDEFGEHLAEDLMPEEFAARQIDWRTHNVVIVTVGVDIGSSTSHLMFSRLFMRLIGEPPAVESVIVGREILWQSPVILTPYLDNGDIDAGALSNFIDDAYGAVGATANEVDTGAIILTGEALKRRNAHALVELFADRTGKFVSAAAGHHLEAVLAVNGSGTLARSRRDQRTLLNVDIGGGTTKLAVVRDGEILATAAIAIGARLIVKDEHGILTRFDEPAQRVAKHLGLSLELGKPVPAPDEARIVEAWTQMIAGLIQRRPVEGLAAQLMLTDPLSADVVPQALTFSGGVSEFLFFREDQDFGDLGRPLAEALRKAMSDGTISLPSIIDPNLGIRATAVGASLFTSQVGVNLHISDESMLPLTNVPVLTPGLALDNGLDGAAIASSIREAATQADLVEGEQPVAIAFKVLDELTTATERQLAQGIHDALPKTVQGGIPFVIMVNETIASTLGAAITEQAGESANFLALEGVSVPHFAYIDVGEVVRPAMMVPVTVKSLLFAGGLDRRSVKQAILAASRPPR
jgi:ethanolamine utilization protein EutA